MTEPDRVAAVEKALGEPYMADFSDEALKVRRNLLVVSLISIASTLAGVRVAPDSLVFGLHLEHLTDHAIGVAISVIVAYLLVHFGWYVVDAIAGWRLRVTGTRLTFVTAGTWGSADLDYPSDPRQSTLYTWLMDKRHVLGHINSCLQTVDERLDAIRTAAERAASPDVAVSAPALITSTNEVQQALVKLRQAIESAQAVEVSPRLQVSLGRFDRWYGFWLRSQNLRWLMIDVGAPLAMGVLALALLGFHH